jgi:hypothetical protein
MTEVLTPRHPSHAVTWHVLLEFNVDLSRTSAPLPALVPRSGPAPAAEDPPAVVPSVQERLNGRPHVLVCWAGRDAFGDTWEPSE